MPKSSLVLAAALCGLAVAAAGGARAADNQTGASSGGHWGFDVGALGLVYPKYEGSDRYRFIGFPIVIPHYYGDNYDPNARPRLTFRGIDDIRYAALRFGNLDIGPLAGYTFGRSASDAARLNGLGNVDGGLILGGFTAWHFDPFFIDAAVGTQVSGNASGSFTVKAGLGANFRPTERLRLTPYLSATYGSAAFMNNYFTITPAQSAASTAHLAAFDAGAGFKNVAFELNASYRLTRRWTLMGSAGYSRLIGDAADSPVTTSADQFSGGFGLTYTFGRTD